MAETRYEFGRNWQRYLKRKFNDERLQLAKQAMLGFLERADLSGSTFLDIGSGSGIHSCAAFLAGAARVVSFDYDAESVAATRWMHQRAGSPPHWSVQQGSVLDASFVETLGRFDVVYAWGVLHHTGDQWAALAQAARCVAPGGRFFLALYDRDMYRSPSPEFWLDVKRRYNRLGPLGRRAMEAWYIGRFVVPKRPSSMLRFARRLAAGEARGMSLYTDVRDWLGGWPMEFSTVDEVRQHAAAHGLSTLKVRQGEGNAEYLLERPTTR